MKRRSESDVKVFDGLAIVQSGRSRDMSGIVSLYTTSNLPLASKLPDGVLVYDTTVSKLKISINGLWVVV